MEYPPDDLSPEERLRRALENIESAPSIAQQIRVMSKDPNHDPKELSRLRSSLLD